MKPAATLWVEAGETRLRQVLGNLLANALDALTEKGPPRRLWLSAQSTPEGVTVYIRDNGPGFCLEALGRAGEPSLWLANNNSPPNARISVSQMASPRPRP